MEALTGEWASDEIDLERPTAARIYDYLLGGSHNFEVDRDVAEQIQQAVPNAAEALRAGRGFLRRAVHHLVGQGIDQFVDIGSGIPTGGNVHEIAQAANPQAHVVYVDIDPVAVVHSQAILAGDPRSSIVHADARDAAAILAHPELTRLIDLTEPVAVLFGGLLHFVPDEDDPAALVGRYVAAVAPGSYVAITHATAQGRPRDLLQALATPQGRCIRLRDRAAVAGLFAGLELVEPGIVQLPLWRPEDPEPAGAAPDRFGTYAGLGRKP